MKNLFILLALSCVSSLSVISQEAFLFKLKDNEVLPASEAFKLETEVTEHELLIKWIIVDEYYIYLDSIKVNANEIPIKHKLLESKIIDHEDIFFGKTKILKDRLIISVKNSSLKDIEVNYQGCSERGFCYPVQSIKIL